jgi:hypothetical protein
LLLCTSTHRYRCDEVDEAITEALRNETPLVNPKLEALRTMISIVRNRGHVAEEELAAFTAGYGEQQVLEIILGFKKVISIITNPSKYACGWSFPKILRKNNSNKERVTTAI